MFKVVQFENSIISVIRDDYVRKVNLTMDNFIVMSKFKARA